MISPIEKASQLVIGSVESVAPDRISVLLDLDAPQSTALNTGVPTGFPRINSYVLIPNETGAVVGIISWLGVERSNFPKRTGLKDFDLIDLPYPLRKMIITPLGTLFNSSNEDYKLERGVVSFPSIGDPVLLPTNHQLKAIVENQGVDRRVPIGTAPLANNAVVAVDPDKLFGRHIAVLGNTGSGKSCSVAGLIRWCLAKASLEREKNEKIGPVNARFIVLDPNGEYLKTFSDISNVRIFKAPPVSASAKDLKLPAWMWNSHEWAAFASASANTQRPILMEGLRNMRNAHTVSAPVERNVKRLFKSRLVQVNSLIGQGASAYSVGFKEKMNCGSLVVGIRDEAQSYSAQAANALKASLEALVAAADAVRQDREYPSSGKIYYNNFIEPDLRKISQAIENVLSLIPDISAATANEDAPIPFPVAEFPSHLDTIASQEGGGNVAQFISLLTMRIRTMLASRRLGPIIEPAEEIVFQQWLEDYIGANNATNGQISILDLSLVPSDVIHIVIAVIARIIFEAAQRYRRIYDTELPTVIVLEEAHHFIQRPGADENLGAAINPSQMCRQTFERIAREGRKFGVGLVLSSQRPSELSATVLSQCNTFLLHRIVNDRDQELVSKLVPDALGNLLDELPSLPSRQAILLGWSTPIPVLVEIQELAKEHRPHSNDPAFWNVWTGEEKREIDWKKISDDWVG